MAAQSKSRGRYRQHRRTGDAPFECRRGSFPPQSHPMTASMLMVDTDIGIVPADGKGVWKPLIATPVADSQGDLSPDGRWLAEPSNETGTVDVYLQPFPGLGNRQIVSVGGGHMPTWSANGRRLFYLQGPPPREVMSAQVEPTPEGGIRIGAPTKVVDWRSSSASYAALLRSCGRWPSPRDRSGRRRRAGRHADINVVINSVRELSYWFRFRAISV